MARPRRRSKNPLGPAFTERPGGPGLTLKVYSVASGTLFGRIEVPDAPRYLDGTEISPEWLEWEGKLYDAIKRSGFGHLVREIDQGYSQGAYPAKYEDVARQPGKGFTWYEIDSETNIEVEVVDLRIVPARQRNPLGPAFEEAGEYDMALWAIRNPGGHYLGGVKLHEDGDSVTMHDIRRVFALIGFGLPLKIAISHATKADLAIYDATPGAQGGESRRVYTLDRLHGWSGPDRERQQNPLGPAFQETEFAGLHAFSIYRFGDGAHLGNVFMREPPDYNLRDAWRTWEIDFRWEMINSAAKDKFTIHGVGWPTLGPTRTITIADLDAISFEMSYRKFTVDSPDVTGELSISFGGSHEFDAVWLHPLGPRKKNPLGPAFEEKPWPDPEESINLRWRTNEAPTHFTEATDFVVARKGGLWAPCQIIVSRVFRVVTTGGDDFVPFHGATLKRGDLIHSSRDEHNTTLHSTDDMAEFAMETGWRRTGKDGTAMSDEETDAAWDWFQDHQDHIFVDPGYFSD
jgi:hypothetical protein